LIDAAKGYLPAKYLPILFIQGLEMGESQYLSVVAGLFAVIGHNYTCWLKFKGGKGIATSAGVLIAWVPVALGITLASWILIFAVTRYVSLASILAAVVLPFAVGVTRAPVHMIAISTVLSALAI